MTTTSEDALLPPCDVLRSMLTTHETVLPDGSRRTLKANISAVDCRALYNAARRIAPSCALEVGMAYGASTLTLLAALKESGGRLISVDPYYNWPTGRKAALHAVYRAGHAGRHEHRCQPSWEALPQLAAEGVRCEFAYIDGSHEFPDVFIDFFYVDKVMQGGGVVGFNDVGWSGVYEVVKHVAARSDYQEVDVGLPADYRGKNAAVTLARTVLRRGRQDRYFQKIQANNG